MLSLNAIATADALALEKRNKKVPGFDCVSIFSASLLDAKPWNHFLFERDDQIVIVCRKAGAILRTQRQVPGVCQAVVEAAQRDESGRHTSIYLHDLYCCNLGGGREKTIVV